MLFADDYLLQDTLYRACGCTAQSSDSASVLDLGKYNHFRETYIVDINKYEVIDVHHWQ